MLLYASVPPCSAYFLFFVFLFLFCLGFFALTYGDEECYDVHYEVTVM